MKTVEQLRIYLNDLLVFYLLLYIYYILYLLLLLLFKGYNLSGGGAEHGNSDISI